MSSAALRLLQLNEEFQNRHDMAGQAREFGKPDWSPRSDDEIAADYAEALKAAIST